MQRRRSWILVLIAVALAVLYFATRRPAEVAEEPDAAESASETTTTPTANADTGPATGEHPYEEAEGDADCTVDCSGHEAGWKWAKAHDVTSEDECGGKSQSFVEGCQAYARHEDSEEGEPAEP